jgi:hypothetical protein
MKNTNPKCPKCKKFTGKTDKPGIYRCRKCAVVCNIHGEQTWQVGDIEPTTVERMSAELAPGEPTTGDLPVQVDTWDTLSAASHAAELSAKLAATAKPVKLNDTQKKLLRLVGLDPVFDLSKRPDIATQTMQALEVRGLVYHCGAPGVTAYELKKRKIGSRTYALTVAGKAALA